MDGIVIEVMHRLSKTSMLVLMVTISILALYPVNVYGLDAMAYNTAMTLTLSYMAISYAIMIIIGMSVNRLNKLPIHHPTIGEGYE